LASSSVSHRIRGADTFGRSKMSGAHHPRLAACLSTAEAGVKNCRSSVAFDVLGYVFRAPRSIASWLMRESGVVPKCRSTASRNRVLPPHSM
jgi:hypothetical protein